jgi:acetyl-CoA C-acetyltransferase
MTEAFIYDALRTPRGDGKPTGALYEIRPIQLLQITLQSLQKRHNLDTALIDDVLIGCVSPTDDQGSNLAKAAVMYAGWDLSVGGMTINRFCASGLEAVNLAAMKVRSGWDSLIVAGGVESMSRVPMGSDMGPLLYDPEVIQTINYIPQGVSADLIATRDGFSRSDLDEYAHQSYERVRKARFENRFSQSLVPIYDQNGLLILEEDEFLHPDTGLSDLAALAPAFAEYGDWGFDHMARIQYPEVARVIPMHTAGNSSRMVDGAALVLVGNKEQGASAGLKPRARIRSAATVSVEPTIMLTGSVPAARKALERAGMKARDIDLWECNEAFASAVLHFQREIKVPNDRLNVNGGAIALGHPLGATGAMQIGALLDELERQDLNTGLVTLCVGGGMGVATIIERV